MRSNDLFMKFLRKYWTRILLWKEEMLKLVSCESPAIPVSISTVISKLRLYFYATLTDFGAI